MKENSVWVKILVIEDFKCRIRRAPQDYKKAYYFIDQVALMLEYCGISFQYFDQVRNLPEIPDSNLTQIVLLGTPRAPFLMKSSLN